MVVSALNECQRDPDKARARVLLAVHADPAALACVVEQAIDAAIGQEIRRDFHEERQTIRRVERARPTVTNDVTVGQPAPRATALPVLSDAQLGRAAANVVHYEGLMALRLPVTRTLLGDAPAHQIQDAFLFHDAQRRGSSVWARFYKKLWLSIPDRDLPASQQKPLHKHLDAAFLKQLDAQAQLEETKVIL